MCIIFSLPLLITFAYKSVRMCELPHPYNGKLAIFTLVKYYVFIFVPMVIHLIKNVMLIV